LVRAVPLVWLEAIPPKPETRIALSAVDGMASGACHLDCHFLQVRVDPAYGKIGVLRFVGIVSTLRRFMERAPTPRRSTREPGGPGGQGHGSG
jgi:hypothetical protein